MTEKEQSEFVEIMARSDGWKIIQSWLILQSSAERLRGATKDSFEAIQAEVNAYDSVLKKVEEFINIKNEE